MTSECHQINEDEEEMKLKQEEEKNLKQQWEKAVAQRRRDRLVQEWTPPVYFLMLMYIVICSLVGMVLGQTNIQQMKNFVNHCQRLRTMPPVKLLDSRKGWNNPTPWNNNNKANSTLQNLH